MTLASQFWDRDGLPITYTHHKSNQQGKCARWFKGKQPCLNAGMGKEEQSLVTETADKWPHKNQKEKPARIRGVHTLRTNRKSRVWSTTPS